MASHHITSPRITSQGTRQQEFHVNKNLLFTLDLFQDLRGIPIRPTINGFIHVGHELQGGSLHRLRPLITRGQRRIRSRQGPLHNSSHVTHRELLTRRHRSLRIRQDAKGVTRRTSIRLLRVRPHVRRHVNLALRGLNSLTPRRRQHRRDSRRRSNRRSNHGLRRFFRRLSILGTGAIISASSGPALQWDTLTTSHTKFSIDVAFPTPVQTTYSATTHADTSPTPRPHTTPSAAASSVRTLHPRNTSCRTDIDAPAVHSPTATTDGSPISLPTAHHGASQRNTPDHNRDYNVDHTGTSSDTSRA